MTAGSDKLQLLYCVHDDYVTQEEFLSAYLTPYLEQDAALQCMQLIHYQIVSIYYDGDDPVSQALIHYDSSCNQKYIRITDYALTVYIRFDYNICMLLSAVFG